MYIYVCVCIYTCICIDINTQERCGYYRVTTISRLLKIIGVFCKRAIQKRLYSAKETYNFKEPTKRSHPIRICTLRGINK